VDGDEEHRGFGISGPRGGQNQHARKHYRQ